VSFLVSLDLRVVVRTVVVPVMSIANLSAMKNGATFDPFGARGVTLLPSSIQNRLWSQLESLGSSIRKAHCGDLAQAPLKPSTEQ
jgi:hypothetical protein